MQITHIGKVAEGQYTISSLPCPSCSTSTTITIDGANLFKYHQGARVQEVLPNETLAVRETFMTGYCSPCWESIFPAFEEDED